MREDVVDGSGLVTGNEDGGPFYLPALTSMVFMRLNLEETGPDAAAREGGAG
jgi:hypothetical protein